MSRIKYVFRFSISLFIGLTAGSEALAYAEIEKVQFENTLLKEQKSEIKSILASGKWIDETKRVWEFSSYDNYSKKGSVKLTSNDKKFTLEGSYHKTQKGELAIVFKSQKFSKDSFNILVKDIKIKDSGLMEFVKSDGNSIKVSKLREV